MVPWSGPIKAISFLSTCPIEKTPHWINSVTTQFQTGLNQQDSFKVLMTETLCSWLSCLGTKLETKLERGGRSGTLSLWSRAPGPQDNPSPGVEFQLEVYTIKLPRRQLLYGRGLHEAGCFCHIKCTEKGVTWERHSRVSKTYSSFQFLHSIHFQDTSDLLTWIIFLKSYLWLRWQTWTLILWWCVIVAAEIQCK